jgi:hypothetical protein
MMDLRNHFDEIAGPIPAETAVDDDILRGRSAMRRRRTSRTIAGSMFAAAAIAAAVTAGSVLVTDTSPRGSTSAVQLVAYEGAQPKGFTIDKVPAGWFVQTDDTGSLTLAPDAAKNPGPDVNPSESPLHDPRSFVGKIGIMLESKDQNGPWGEGIKVKVGDNDGTLLKSPTEGSVRADGDTGWQLFVKQPSGPYLLLQFWEGLGLSQDQMVELAAGVHVHEDAVQGVG